MSNCTMFPSLSFVALHGEMQNFRSKKTFILVSTVLTWAMTKRPETVSIATVQQSADAITNASFLQEEPERFITEEEFRKRRPHPSFKHHNNMEKQVLKLGTGVRSLLWKNTHRHVT